MEKISHFVFFRAVTQTRLCLALYSDCQSDVYSALVAKVDIHYETCTPPPNECAGVDVYVECYRSLHLYLNSCGTQDCGSRQACL